MKKLLLSAAFAVSAMIGAPAFADYPDGPVQFVVPWPPGDFEDILTRMIAADMSEATGQSASVVNKPGGGDGPFPGALEVLAAPADGSMVGSFVIGVPIVGPKIDIGIEEDSFVPVGIFLTYPFVLAASGDAPYAGPLCRAPRCAPLAACPVGGRDQTGGGSGACRRGAGPS